MGIRNAFAALGHAFGGVDLESASAALEKDVARFSQKHRVTVALPKGAPGTRFVVYSRVASDRALLDRHDAHPTDFDAFDVAEGGEVLNLLVDPGYHRIHAVELPKDAPRRWLGTRGMLLMIPKDPEYGVLLYQGDIHSDVGLA